VWECGEGQTHTDTQTAVTTIHFADSREMRLRVGCTGGTQHTESQRRVRDFGAAFAEAREPGETDAAET